MAGAKINTKAKGKDDKSKGNKTMNSTNEENEDHDFSLLRKPVLTSITGFAQARKIFDFATEELKGLLANECDLLYECKVCRNIFRSLANFISHKRVYCKEKFNSSVHSHFVKNNTAANEILKIKQMEEAYQESLKITDLASNESEDRIPLTKDLTGIMEKLAKMKGRYGFDEQQVTLQKIPNSSVAMFQSHFEESKFDSMLSQVHELDNMLSQDNAVLQRDGSFNVQSSLNADKSEDVIQISDDDDSDEGSAPKCKICDMQFSTQKTLKFHMKYKHHESRLVYPCPDCFEIFSTSWSVYRHLFKVHRKSAAQIRRLREAIQAKAFRMDNPPAIYEKKKNSKPITPQKISEEERLDQENQAWMDNLEGDGELPRCGGCGRTFERRAALAAHTHTCQPRCRALARRPDNKRIEIQIRKDYNKGPGGNPLAKDNDKQVAEESQAATKNHPEKNAEPTEKVTESPEKVTETPEKTPEKTGPEEKTPSPEKMDTSTKEDTEPSAEKDAQPAENVLEEATMDIIDERSSDSVDSPEKAVKPVEKKPKMRLPFAHQAEKSNLAAFKQRMRPDVDIDKMLCKKCDTKHTRYAELYEHMATHYKWLRYACKLCNFKSYEFEKLPEHVKIVHKLKGDSDFYYSTVKAIDGIEATDLADPVEESDVNEESSESRRPSRCSSDSSRLSDDSSSSSTRVEGARKRKMYHNRSIAKKKKEATEDTSENKDKESGADKNTNNIGNSESPSNVKAFEENSSDMDDTEDKTTKKTTVGELPTVTSRRPVRKKTKPKNEDFEYDLSNLLKMEAQGYRDSQTITVTKTAQTKKKQQELQSNYDIINKDHIGALALLSKNAVDKAAAEPKTTTFSSPVYNLHNEPRIPNIFARPMAPKAARNDKMSPRKENIEDAVKDGPSSNKVPKCIQDPTPTKEPIKNDKAPTIEEKTNKPANVETAPTTNAAKDTSPETEQPVISETNENPAPPLKIPAVVPLKFRRQSLELMKNPIINKNISEFSKAGMKTKILLIKPINRNKDGVTVNAPLKFQTIKLKEQNKGTTSNEENSNDQIVVVKVPKVNRTVASDNNINSKKIVAPVKSDSTVNNIAAKLVIDKIVQPISAKDLPKINANNNTSTSINSETTNVVSNSADTIPNDISKTETLLGNSEKETSVVNNDGCGSEVNSDKPEPMDVEPNKTLIPVTDLDSIKELTNVTYTSVHESPINEPTDSSLSQESSSTISDAITSQESVDSTVLPNDTSA